MALPVARYPDPPAAKHRSGARSAARRSDRCRRAPAPNASAGAPAEQPASIGDGLRLWAHRDSSTSRAIRRSMSASTRACASSPTILPGPPHAERELRLIERALGPVAARLEHVGSTAVAGLAAKPILDLLLSVVRIEPRAAYAEPLERLGYLFVARPRLPRLPSVRQAGAAAAIAPPARLRARRRCTKRVTWPCANTCAPTPPRRAR